MEGSEFVGSLLAVFPFKVETRNTFRYTSEQGLEEGEMIGSIYIPKSSLLTLSESEQRPDALLVVVQPDV